MIDGSQYIKKNTEFENYECEGRGIYITKISLFSFKLEFHLQMSPLAYEPLKCRHRTTTEVDERPSNLA